MSVVTQFLIMGAVDIVLEALAWGTFGYFLFRFIGVNEKHWKWDYLVVLILYLAWDSWGGAFLAKLDISIGNQEIMAFLDNDINSLFERDSWDIVISAIEIMAGYQLGKFMLKRIKHRQAPSQ